MNIQRFKTGLYVALVLFFILGVLKVALVHHQEDSAWQARYYSKFPHLTPEQRLELNKEIAAELDSGHRLSPYDFVRVQHKVQLLERSERRNFALDQDVALPATQRESMTLPTTGMLLIKLGKVEQQMSSGYTPTDFLEADRVLATGPLYSMSETEAAYLAGKINWLRVGMWAVVVFSGCILLSLGIYICRAVAQGLPVWTLLFDPCFYVALPGFVWGVFRYLDNIDVKAQMRNAMRFAGLLLAAAMSVSGGTIKVFAQDKKDDGNTDEGGHTKVVTQPKVWTVVIEGGVATIYHGSFVGASFHDGMVATSSMTITHQPSGVRFTVWNSQAVTNRYFANTGTELDWTLGVKREVHQWNFDLSATWVNGRPLGSSKGDVLTLAAEVSRNFKRNDVHDYSYQPFVAIRHAAPIHQDGPGAGWVIESGVNNSLRLNKRFTLSNTVSIVGNSRIFGFNPGAHANFDAGVSLKASNHLSLELGSKVTIPLTRSGDGRHPLASARAGFKLNW